jgi:hypothetical protein
MQGRRHARGARRAGLVAGSLTTAVLATVVAAPPASAEVLSKARIDSFTFTVTNTTTRVTCDIMSVLDYDTSLQQFTAKTLIAGPEERPECRGSWPEVTVDTPEGRHHAQGYGGVVDLSYRPVGDSLTSTHTVYFQACECFSPAVFQTLPK